MPLSKTISFLQKEILANEIDLNIVGRLAAENALPDGWMLRASSNKRRLSMQGRKTYITCEDADKEKGYEAFLQLCKKLLKQDYTSAGAGQILLILYTVGFIADANRVKGFKQIAALIDDNRYKSMLQEFIKQFNQSSASITKIESSEPPFDFFDELSFRIQYEEDYDHPVHILRLLLAIKKKNLPGLQMIATIDPLPRMAIAAFGFPVATSQKEFINYLKDNTAEIPFWGHCFIDTYHENYPFIKTKAIRLFIQDWKNTGKYIFRKIYSNPHYGRFEQGNKKQLPRLFTAYLFDQFFKAGIDNTVLSEALFKTDLAAIGAWLTIIKSRKKAVLNASSIRQLGKLNADHFNEMADNMSNYISNHSERYNAWFNNMQYVQTQMTIQLLNVALLNTEDKLWHIIVQSFKKLCHQIKLYFYAAHTASHLALEFTNHLLCLMVQFPKMTTMGPHAERTKQLFEVFTSAIGYPWIVFTERKKMVWDADNWKPNETFAELEFILTKLKGLDKKQREIAAPLFTAITTHATLPWPI